MAESALVPGDGYISDGSDFYGTAKLRNKLESRSKHVNILQLTRDRAKNKVSFPTASDTSFRPVQQILINPMEGDLSARQLTESADEFLKRLPPKTTSSLECGPWIWVMNPIVKGKGKKATTRGPEYEGDCGITMALALLEQFDDEQKRIKDQAPNAAQSTITRKLSPLRDKLKEAVLDLAVADDLTSGKWMLFPKPEDVNRIWKTVVEAVIDGRLGDGAKIATSDPANVFVVGTRTESSSSRLICIYTKDFSDLEDVRRVLLELVELGLAPRKGEKSAIYYKADVYTYLGLDSNNRFGLKASLYSSKDLLNMASNAKRKLKDNDGGKVSEVKKQKTLDWYGMWTRYDGR